MEKIQGFNFQDLSPKCLVISSNFSVLFPQYQENYLRESWNIISRITRPYGLKVDLDLTSGKMQIKTSKETRDPFVIFKGRDFLRLLARSVPVQQACKIFEDEVFCDIVKISNLGLSKKNFLKRRKRIIGYHGLTIRAIEIVTECYLLVQGNTVCCMGKHKGLKMARGIIRDCMLNIHPISQVKKLWFKKCLSKDPHFKLKSWENFFPSFEKNSQNKRLFLKKTSPVIEKNQKKNPNLYEARLFSDKINKEKYDSNLNNNLICPFNE